MSLLSVRIKVGLWR